MAALSGLSANHIRKLVRYAVSQKIFEELRPGVITHSAASRLLAEDTAVHDYVFCASDEFWQASAQTCNAMAQFPGSEEPTETVRVPEVRGRSILDAYTNNQSRTGLRLGQ